MGADNEDRAEQLADLKKRLLPKLKAELKRKKPKNEKEAKQNLTNFLKRILADLELSNEEKQQLSNELLPAMRKDIKAAISAKRDEMTRQAMANARYNQIVLSKPTQKGSSVIEKLLAILQTLGFDSIQKAVAHVAAKIVEQFKPEEVEEIAVQIRSDKGFLDAILKTHQGEQLNDVDIAAQRAGFARFAQMKQLRDDALLAKLTAQHDLPPALVNHIGENMDDLREDIIRTIAVQDQLQHTATYRTPTPFNMTPYNTY